KGCEGCDFCRFRERAGSPTEDAGTCVRLPRPLTIGLDPENARSDLIIDANLAADDSALRLPTAASTHGPTRCRHGRIFKRRVAVASVGPDVEARPGGARHFDRGAGRRTRVQSRSITPGQARARGEGIQTARREGRALVVALPQDVPEGTDDEPE